MESKKTKRKESPKILFVSINVTAGFYAYVPDFVNAVSKRVDKVVILLGGAVEEGLFAKKVRVISLTYKGGGWLKKFFLLNPVFSSEFRRYLIQERPDVIHFLFHHNSNFLIIVMAQFLRLNAKIIFTIHNYDRTPRRFWHLRNRAEALMMHLSDKIIFVSDFLEKKVLADKPELSKKSGIFELGAPMWWEKYKVSGQEENLVLLFGRQDYMRGTDILYRAEHFISKKIKNYKIAILGPDDAGIHEKFQKRGDLHYEILDYYVSNQTLADFLNRAKIVVLPYRTTPVHSGVLVTAFVFGKAVIASRVGAFPDIIEDGKNGILVELDNPKVLGETINELLTNEKKRKKIAAVARQAALTRFNYQSQVGRYLRFIQE